MHPQAGNSMYLKIGVDGRDLRGAARGHTGPDDLNGRVGRGFLQGRGS